MRKGEKHSMFKTTKMLQYEQTLKMIKKKTAILGITEG